MKSLQITSSSGLLIGKHGAGRQLPACVAACMRPRYSSWSYEWTELRLETMESNGRNESITLSYRYFKVGGGLEVSMAGHATGVTVHVSKKSNSARQELPST